MPLVGRFIPSYTITIAKRRNAFRFETNVVGISSVQPVYQHAMVLFLDSKRLAPLLLTRRRREDELNDHDARTVQRLRATKRLELDIHKALRQDVIKTHVLSKRVTLERTGAQRQLLGYTCDEYRLADVPWVSKKRSHGAEPNAVFSVDDGLLGDDEHISIKRRSSSSARGVWQTPLSRRRR